MSLYAVKNDKGEYLNGVAGEKPLFGGLDKYCVLNGKDAGWWAGRGCGHVVELVEAPAKVVVSEADAEILRGLDKFHFPASEIARQSETTRHQDRLMRAYVNGWTVEKQKRYVLPMPDGIEGESWRAMHIAIREKDEGWYGSACHYDITASETPSYTRADIDAAPDWVKSITPIEVTDDEQ